MSSHAANSSSAVALAQQVAWDDLRIILTLAQASSTRLAASRLGINASTISRKVNALEEVLGARLFERHPDGLRLTRAGSDVVDAAAQMSEFVRTMTRRVAGADRNLVGTVRVSVPEVMAALVADAMARLLVEQPGLVIEFRVDDQFADLARHEADIAVRVADEPPAELLGRRLGSASVGVYASERYWSTHSYELSDERHRWVEWPAYVQRKAAYGWLNQQVPSRRAAVHAGSSGAVLAAVAAGIGLAPIAHAHARRHPSLTARWMLPPECGTAVWALTHREVARNARVRAVLSALSGIEV